MKSLVSFLIVLIAIFGFWYYQNYSVCWQPLAYDVGVFDSRFNMNKDKFVSVLKESEAIWEKNIGRDLFNYQPSAKFKINLIFDDRQARTFEATESKEEIEGSRAQYDRLLNEYKTLAASHKRELDAYNLAVSRFESRLNSYNNRVNEANSRGGASSKEFKDLQAERDALQVEQNRLEGQRASINSEASRLNNLTDRVNDLAGQLNIEVDLHNERFGEAREFDQGEYAGDRINIYQFDTVSDLRLVLAHEFGHALGVDHVENPKSIMYYLMDEQDLKNPVLTREDIAALKNRCNF